MKPTQRQPIMPAHTLKGHARQLLSVSISGDSTQTHAYVHIYIHIY